MMYQKFCYVVHVGDWLIEKCVNLQAHDLTLVSSTQTPGTNYTNRNTRRGIQDRYFRRYPR